MTELSLLSDPSSIHLWNSEAWPTLALLVGLLVAAIWSMERYGETPIARLMLVLTGGRRDAWAVARRLGRRRHMHFAIVWPALIGGWAGLARLFGTADFDWYLSEALTWWPDYGSALLWLANAGIGLLAMGLAGLTASLLTTYGPLGLLLVPLYAGLGAAAATVGLLLGPLALVALALGRRGAPLAALGGDAAELAARLLIEPIQARRST